MAEEDKKGDDFDADHMFQTAARASMIQLEGMPLNRRPAAGPKPQWKNDALNNMLNRNPKLRALHKPPPTVALKEDEEDLFRAYTGPGKAIGSSSRHRATASSSGNNNGGTLVWPLE